MTRSWLFLAAIFMVMPASWGEQKDKDTQPSPTEASFIGKDLADDPLPPGAVNRIGSNRFRHVGNVVCVLYTPDGMSIASTSADGYLRLWDDASGKLRWRVAVKDIMYRSDLVISADGKQLAVLTDTEYLVVATETGKKIVQREWARGTKYEAIRGLAIAPDLRTLARAYLDGTVQLHDAGTGQVQVRIVVGKKEIPGSLQYNWAMKFSADGKTIYVLADDYEELADGKDAVRVFDTNTGKEAKSLATQKAYNCRLILSQKHRFLASMGSMGAVLWDLTGGTRRDLVEMPSSFPVIGALSPDASLFAFVGDEPGIALIDTATGKERHRLPAHPHSYSIAFAPDGKTLASAGAGGYIDLFDVVTGKPRVSLPEPNDLWRIRFGNSGKQILLFGDDVAWWDVKSAKLVRRVAPDPNRYGRPSVSPDGKVLATAVTTRDLVLIDTATGEHLRTLVGHNSWTTVFSTDGTKLFAGGWSDEQSDRRIIIWDVATGKPLDELPSTFFVDRLAMSPNGRWLAAQNWTGGEAQTIQIWNVATGKLVHSLGKGPASAYSMVFSADSSRLVFVGGEGYTPSNSGWVQLWSVATGKEVRAFAGHKDCVRCIAMTPDGRMLATGSDDKTLRLWEIASGKERGRIPGHEACVHSVDFSPDGRLLAAASIDAPVIIWDAYAIQKPTLIGTKLVKADREKLWRKLADPDGAVAFQTMCELIASPSEAVAVLKDGWRRLPRPTQATPKQMRQWVEDLSSEQFTVRQAATAALERYAGGYENLLGDALKQAGSLEARQRLEKILGGIDPEILRQGRVLEERMLEVLEQLHTAPARQFLQALAEQEEDAFMAREAAASLKRLKQ